MSRAKADGQVNHWDFVAKGLCKVVSIEMHLFSFPKEMESSLKPRQKMNNLYVRNRVLRLTRPLTSICGVTEIKSHK